MNHVPFWGLNNLKARVSGIGEFSSNEIQPPQLGMRSGAPVPHQSGISPFEENQKCELRSKLRGCFKDCDLALLSDIQIATPIPEIGNLHAPFDKPAPTNDMKGAWDG